MDSEKAKKFIYEHRKTTFYQPIIFKPGVLEIRGKWHGATKELADIILDDIKDKSLLDVGCNVGFFLHEAIKRGAKEIVGIDHDKVIIDLATQIKHILHCPISILHEDLDQFNVKFFDITLMLNVLHVIPDVIQTISKYLTCCNQLVIECDIEIAKVVESNFLLQSQQASPRASGSRLISVLVNSSSDIGISVK